MDKIIPARVDGLFYNDVPTHHTWDLIKSVPWYLQSYKARRSFDLPAFVAKWFSPHAQPHATSHTRVWWLGHATFLIQIDGVNLLTDPIFGNASFLFKRQLPVGIGIDRLTSIDAILISHNHRDHLDTVSLGMLAKRWPKAKILVPWGDEALVRSCGANDIHKHTWWDTTSVGKLACSFVPAYHWSGRGLFDHNRALWGGWIINGKQHTIFFAGDTAYWHHFAYIKKRLGPIDAAILPIGPRHPYEVMRQVHLDAHSAIQAFTDLQAKHFIPMHWGTFCFGIDTPEEPIKLLTQNWQLPTENAHLRIPICGQYIQL